MYILYKTYKLTLTVYQVVQALGTEASRPSSAAQVIAGIACAEIPLQQWPDLVPKLVQSVTNQGSTETLKEAALEAIGYVCSDMVHKCFMSMITGLYLINLATIFAPNFTGTRTSYYILE